MRKRILIAFLMMLVLIVAVSVRIVRGHEGYYDTLDTSAMMQGLARIDTWMKAQAPQMAEGFQAPLARRDIEQLAKKRGVKMPEEALALYSWHNGGAKGTTLFGEFGFLPVEEAFAYGDAIHKAFPSEPFKLPLFRSETSAAAYTVDCLKDISWETRVQFTYNGATTETDTLTNFISALDQAMEIGTFQYSKAKGMEVRRARFERAFLDVHPQRKNAIDMVLKGLADHITPDEEMEAYSDLLETENPKAEKFVLLAAERWAVDEEYGFSTMQLLARLDTHPAFDAMEKLIRNGNPQVRKRAYGMMAFWWPQDGRKLDAATEDFAIQDLGSPAFSNLDRRMVVRVLRRAPEAWVPAVVNVLANPEKDTRIAAAETLGMLGDPRALAALQARAAQETDDDARAACYHALADLGDSAGERELRAVLSKADPMTLEHAVRNGSPAEKRLAKQLTETKKS